MAFTQVSALSVTHCLPGSPAERSIKHTDQDLLHLFPLLSLLFHSKSHGRVSISSVWLQSETIWLWYFPKLEKKKKSSKVGGLQAEFSVYRDVSCWPAVLNSFAFKYSSRDIHSLVCHSPYPSLLPYTQLGSFLWSSLFPSLWFCDP